MIVKKAKRFISAREFDILYRLELNGMTLFIVGRVILLLHEQEPWVYIKSNEEVCFVSSCVFSKTFLFQVYVEHRHINDQLDIILMSPWSETIDIT